MMWTHLYCLSAVLILFLVSPLFGMERCVLQQLPQRTNRYFRINGLDSVSVTFGFDIMTLSGNKMNETECLIDIRDIFVKDLDTTDTKIRAYSFGCMKPMRIFINGTHKAKHKIISIVQLYQCDIGIDSLGYISNITFLMALDLTGHSTLLFSADRYYCSALDGIGALMVANERYQSPAMEVFYACKDHLSATVEIILSNLSLSSLPKDLDKYMPNLQGLDLRRNNFTTPPLFPWDNNTRTLPYNMSRTDFLQHQYTYGTVTIPDNEFRREYRLDDNPHLNLTGYTFRGYLQILSLARCGLRSLKSDVLLEVVGMQYLSLEGNWLTELPQGLFLKSSKLRKLELQGNQLNCLESQGFEGLVSLTHLNLATNELTSLQDGLFDPLIKLEVIDLSDNKIRDISSRAFSELLVNLNVLVLVNNSLTDMPESLLMLRSLYYIMLQGNNITSLDITTVDQNLPFQKFVSTIVDTASSANPDIDIPADGLRRVDFSGCNINTISFTPGDRSSIVKVAVLLKYFKFVLDNNDIVCDCNILNLTTFVQDIIQNKTISSAIKPLNLDGSEYPFRYWKCAKPQELAERNILSVKDEETYCPFKTPGCPSKCTCYKRSAIGTNIVDCRGVGLTEAPDILPEGDTELWLQDNHISEFKIGNHLSKQLVELHLERNGLEKLDSESTSHMVKLRRLYIDNNLLAYVPKKIQKLDFEVVRFGGNPFQCDCHSLWMKKWLLKHFDIVEDSFELKCNNNVDDSGTNILEVDDEDFVCDQKITVTNIIIYIVIPTGIVLILVILSVLLFIFWKDFKVFLFVHTGIHPFDKKDPEGMLCYDVFIAYPPCIADWVHENIVRQLQDMGQYKLYDVANDFKFGYSLQDNIQHGIKHSRRMVLVLSKDCHTDALVQLAIEAGLEKCREGKANFLVPILYNISPRDIENEQLQKYLRSNKTFSNKSSHFFKKLLYQMPTVPLAMAPEEKVCGDDIDNITCVNEIDMSIIPTHQDQQAYGGSTVFVWYTDADFRFMMDAIVNPFEAEGHRFILSDKSFIPGASIQENILHAIEDSDRTIIILSMESLVDEWTLYAFRFATERQMLQKCFLTGLVVREGLMDRTCDEEIVKHLLAYQPLSEKDGDFHSKMRTFMQSSLKKSSRNESCLKLPTICTKL